MKTVLVVDDEPEVLDVTCKRLTASGYRACGARDGVEGLKAARAERPDLILLDIMMPGKDGLTMLRELKADDATARIPIIMLTARGGAEHMFKGEEYGAIDYFIKPCDWQELLKYIKKYMEIAELPSP